MNATIKCPECDHERTEEMPEDRCIWFYECTSCSVLLSPLPGDCCVFCSYSDQVCPPKQCKKLC
jgi:hypothetical protein